MLVEVRRGVFESGDLSVFQAGFGIKNVATHGLSLEAASCWALLPHHWIMVHVRLRKEHERHALLNKNAFFFFTLLCVTCNVSWPTPACEKMKYKPRSPVWNLIKQEDTLIFELSRFNIWKATFMCMMQTWCKGTGKRHLMPVVWCSDSSDAEGSVKRRTGCPNPSQLLLLCSATSSANPLLSKHTFPVVCLAVRPVLTLPFKIKKLPPWFRFLFSGMPWIHNFHYNK